MSRQAAALGAVAGLAFACSAGPERSLPGDPERGAAHYAQFCTPCHGPSGDGDGPVAASTPPPKPAKHSDGTYMNDLSNEHLFEVVKFGGAAAGKSPVMPSWKRHFSDDDINDIISFVRTLADPPYLR